MTTIISFYFFALSDTNGLSLLQIPKQFSSNEGLFFIGNVSLGEVSDNCIEIDVKRLDDILDSEKQINLIKIDVEGHEFNVLKGTEKNLNKKNILNIIYEDYSSFPSSVSDYLVSMGYSIFRVEKSDNGIFLADPKSRSFISSWEPTNI